MTHAMLFLPETVTALSALAVFICCVVEVRHGLTWWISVAGGLLMTLASIITLGSSGEPFFPGIYHVDIFSQILKLVFAAAFVLVLILGRDPMTIRAGARNEFPLFLLFSTLGMMMLVSATELITLYLALELSAFPLYILVAIHRERILASEGAVKYMLQGMVASAITLYGMSFLFGMTGSTYLSEIAAQAGGLADKPLFWIGAMMAFAGFLFKVGLFPFHFWTPDTYQTGPHPVVAFIATASKVATIAVLCRLVGLLIPVENAAAGETFRFALLCFSVAAMTIGNLAAIAQHDLKRLLGYSAMAHAGYLMVGLQSFNDLGLTSALFYALGYFAISYLVFLVVCEVGRDSDSVSIESVSGLSRRSPLLALCLLTGIFGLTGLPPTVGFIGKWFLFSAALERGQFILVLIAAVNSAVAIFYYLKVLRQAYLVAPTEETPLKLSPYVVASGAVACLVVVWMGTAPGVAWEVARGAAAVLSHR